MALSFSKNNPSPGEEVREYYRRQGEQRMLAKVIEELEELCAYRKEASWSPVYIINLLKGIDENRNAGDSETNARSE